MILSATILPFCSVLIPIREIREIRGVPIQLRLRLRRAKFIRGCNPQNPKIPHLKVTQFAPHPCKKRAFPAKFLNSPYLSRYDARLHMAPAKLI
jgi:hypothetical protein